MWKQIKFIVLMSLSLLCASASAEHVRFEAFTGGAVSLPTPLTIQQTGYPTISVPQAQYANNPWMPGAAPYYSARIGLWNAEETSAWELELLHHKIYLTNGPPEIQQFQITFGYNMLFVNRAWKLGKHFNLRVGVGPVVCHPISTVNGLTYTGQMYSLAGVAYQVGLQARTKILGPVSGSLETKLTGSSATVPVAQGTASVPNVAVHFLFGMGVDF